MNDDFELMRGEERHAAAPETFWLPERREREGLQPGDHAKLMFRDPLMDSPNIERMWVQVTERVDGGGYLGTLANDPARLALTYGQIVEFKPEHVIDTLGRPEQMGD